MKRIASVLFLVILLTGCQSIKELYIETYNPAEITYPEAVARILIVNNTVPQPPDVGYELYLLGKQQDTCRANADSAAWDACKTLGKAIIEANYFEDVLLYHFPTRTDDRFIADGKMSAEKVRELCKETGTDAIISFDRLLFNMRKDVDAVSNDEFQGKIKVEVGGIVRTYLPDRTIPLASVVVNDSLEFREYAVHQELLDVFLPTPDVALRAAGTYIGATLYPTFVPYWDEEKRWYYTGAGSRWKEASAYAAAGKWTEALESWHTLYTKSSNKKIKAKLASNMALGEEMTGHFDKAHHWAVTSKDLFKETEGEEAMHTKLLHAYTAVLQQRIQSDKKLDIQFGE
ncbi:DUF6340 family protein [Parabacteroides sp. PF5-6]|uniref:DUF6340 family protein n=1 Tax=Parabacteroides sp. PF5-6 TaxID=1742403 RepID=UPI0024069F06|nr:DUF6340 family protein [Parabacteroides sp. PF5-6]MDF9830026.1 hypothetical protein [Parabacteroides sp. PF5-6]